MLKSWGSRRRRKQEKDGGSPSVPKKSQRESTRKIFGESLPADLEGLPDGSYDPRHFIDGIPVVVYKTIRYLYKNGLMTEGLFRIPGSNSEIQSLKTKFDAGENVNLDESCSSPHEAAGLLKQYFRELPEPLLTYDLYDVLQSTISTVTDEEEKRKRLRSVIFLLPVVNYETLGALLKFMKRVTDLSEVNKMSSVNLAICMAPNLIKERSAEGAGGFLNTGNSTMLMKTLIDECDYIFEEVEFPEEDKSQSDVNDGAPMNTSDASNSDVTS